MRSACNQCRTPKFKPAAIDELHSAFGHLAIGANEARKPGDTQLCGTGVTYRMESRRRVSRRKLTDNQ